MSYMRFNFRSDALGRYVDVSIVYPAENYCYYDTSSDPNYHLLPEQKTKPVYRPGMKFQTIYLIHGGGDDDTLTYRYTNAERYALENNVMLVTPNITNSFGADANYGVKYATFLGEELPVVIQTLFASSPKREDNFIVGYAMGGNVALASAIMYPERYHTCVDMSGGIGYTLNTETLKEELRSDHFRNKFPIYLTTFGDPEELEGSRHDLRKIALEKLNAGETLSRFHLIVGSDEFIYDRVRADAEALKEIGYDVTYTCVEGYKHDFTLWDKYLDVIMREILPLKREP